MRAEPTLVNIGKTHDKMKAESKGIIIIHVSARQQYSQSMYPAVSAYFKNKLKSLYQAAQDDARKETEYVSFLQYNSLMH